MKRHLFFGLHAEPPRLLKWLLGALPFIIIIGIYQIASDIRLAENPDDRLLPSFFTMAQTFWEMATVPEEFTGRLLLWTDTGYSLMRLGIGVTSGAIVGLLLGIHIGLFAGYRALLNPLLTVLSIIPPLALMPILNLSIHGEEKFKIVLIFIGTVFVIARDMYLTTKELPREQIIKALTLGASEFGVVYRVVLPQVMPRLINTTSIAMGAAWLFLIAAEGVEANIGLGFRINVVRHNLAMDVTIPYVMWLTMIGCTLVWGLRFINRKVYPWYDPKKEGV